MVYLIGRITNISVSYSTGRPLITFELEDKVSAFNMAEKLLPEKRLAIKVGKYKKKRSLDANAYCWVLIGKLAEKLNVTTTEVYRQAIKEIGGNSDTVCVQDKAVQSLCDGWARNGIGWQTDTFPSKIEGCTNVILYYGSSTYDSSQMHRLLEFVLEECRLQNIDTKTKEEIDSLLGQWG